MLAEVGAAVPLVAQRVDQQLGVPGMIAATSPRWAAPASGRPANAASQVGEQPRPAQAAAADDDAVDAGVRHHPQRVGGLPDVAVAQHRHVERLLERGDRVPVGGAGVALLGRARVQRHRGDAGLLRDQPGLDVRQVVVVDALAHLDGDRDAGGRGRLDRLLRRSGRRACAARAAPSRRRAGSPWAPGSRS